MFIGGSKFYGFEAILNFLNMSFYLENLILIHFKTRMISTLIPTVWIGKLWAFKDDEDVESSFFNKYKEINGKLASR